MIIFWEYFDFDFKLENLVFGIILNYLAIRLAISVFKDLKKRKHYFNYDTIPFHCILISVR